MPLEELLPSWVRTSEFLLHLSRNHCRSLSLDEGQWGNDIPDWSHYLEATDYEMGIGTMISRGCPAPSRNDWNNSKDEKSIRSDLQQQCRVYVGRRVRISRLMSRMKQETLDSLVGFKPGDHRISQIERGTVGLPVDVGNKIGAALGFAGSWLRWIHPAFAPNNFQCREYEDIIISAAIGKDRLPETLCGGSPAWIHSFLCWTSIRPQLKKLTGVDLLLPMFETPPVKFTDWPVLPVKINPIENN